MSELPRRTQLGLLVAASCLLGATSCGPDLPPSLPSTDAHARSASRVELVDLVISDRARAAKVRRLYVEIEELMLVVKRTTAGQILKLGHDDPMRTDADTRAAVVKVRDVDVAGFKRYIGLQMELRRSMSAEEFAKLDGIK